MQKFWLMCALLMAAPTSSARDLLEIEITSGVRAESKVEVPAQITVISREDIMRSHHSSVSDVLRGKTGFQVTDLRGDGADTNISLRGFSQTANANVLILVDGRRLNYADTRNPDLSHISLQDIERIEVIQGSAGTLYGDQAVGGVVNIITRRTAARLLQASASLGSYGRGQMSLAIGEQLDNGVSWRLALDTLTTDGYRDHSARSFSSVSSLINYDYDRGSLFVEAQVVKDDLELPGALLEVDYDEDRRQINAGFTNDYSDSDVAVVRAGIRHRLSNHWHFETELSSRETDQDLTQSFQNLPSPDGGYGRRNALSFNPRLIGSYGLHNGDMLWTLGADVENNHYRVFIPNAFGATSQSNDQHTGALYAQLVYPVSPKIGLTTGLRVASVDNDLWDAAVFPADQAVDDRVTVGTLGVNFRYSDELRFFARLDENFRFAKVNEITGAGGSVLDTQTGLSYEVGMEWHSGSRYLDVGIYRLDLQDEIYFDPTVGLFGTNVNLDKTRRKGMTINAGAEINGHWQLSANYTYTHAKFASGGLDGNYISGVSPHILTTRLTYQPSRAWSIAGEYQLLSNKYAVGDNLNKQRKASGYGVLNMNARYQNGNWEFTLQGNNLLGKEYAEFITDNGFGRGYQSSPERNVLATAGYRFQ